VKRREFFAGFGSAVAMPVAAWAQQGDRVRRIGVLSNLAAVTEAAGAPPFKWPDRLVVFA
jgi:hypothetical protein